jgi:putative oxidoreductase
MQGGIAFTKNETSSNQKGEGYEYHLLAIAIAAALQLRGAGKFSVDHALTK